MLVLFYWYFLKCLSFFYFAWEAFRFRLGFEVCGTLFGACGVLNKLEFSLSFSGV